MAHIRQDGRHGQLISCVSGKSMGALIVVIMLMVSPDLVCATFDYADALGKSILFFEAQRSGRLPPSNRVPWRGDSGLQDGKAQYVDLVGGYYDAGDHVKFGLPQAFTITMLSWGVVEYGRHMAAVGQLDDALDAIRWGTDYFIKAHPEPNVFWAEVGDGDSDHDCWMRAEDMTTSRTAYKLDASHPGSEVAAETAAAMAAASIAFRHKDPPYSQSLLLHSRQLFKFADTYQGNYDDSIPVAKEYYGSVSGYKDELLWAALWLYEATGDNAYLDYALNNANSYGGTGWMMKELSWDVKYAGVQILASKVFLGGGYKGGNTTILKQFQEGAEFYICSLMQKNGGNNVQRTSGGVLYTRPWNNMQYVTTASFALSVYSDYLSASNQQLHCLAGTVPPTELLKVAQSQVNYILGDNPMKMSYMVGYGQNYPQRVHHRGSSIVPFNKNPLVHVGCKDGYANWYKRPAPNPTVLVGAIVGGPDQYDKYADERTRYEQSEPTTCTSGPLVGLLARFAASSPRPLDNDHYQARPASPPPPVSTLPPPVSRRNSTTSYGAPRRPSSSQTPPPAPPSAPKYTAPPQRQPSRGQRYVRPLIIRQIVTTSWIYKNKHYRRIEVRVTNVSKQKISNLRLLIKDLSGPIWGVTKVRESVNLYTFPPWLTSLDPHDTITFVYVQLGPLAVVSMATSSTMTY